MGTIKIHVVFYTKIFLAPIFLLSIKQKCFNDIKNKKDDYKAEMKGKKI